MAREYASFRGKVIILWDDNIAGDIDYAKDLFRALAPHRKWWSSQASIHAARDDEFLELAARSGCKQLFIGLESISQASMNDVAKGFNRVDEYARAIERIHAHGIAVQAGSFLASTTTRRRCSRRRWTSWRRPGCRTPHSTS